MHFIFFVGSIRIPTTLSNVTPKITIIIVKIPNLNIASQSAGNKGRIQNIVKILKKKNILIEIVEQQYKWNAHILYRFSHSGIIKNHESM